MRTGSPVVLCMVGRAGAVRMLRMLGVTGRFFVPAVVLCILFTPPAPVHAAPPPVDLQLCVAGAASWNVTNIKPGDSGTQRLSLCNAGDRSGVLSIWISDICDCEDVNPEPETGDTSQPGELSAYLLFRPVSSRLSTNIPLPATLAGFPQSPDDARRINISPIGPGETVDLVWEWRLPTPVGNDVQGDGVSFTLNYTLTEMPVTPVSDDDGGGASPPAPVSTPTALIVTSSERQILVTTTGGSTVAETQTVVAISNSVTLFFERGTQIITGDNSEPTELQVTLSEEMPPPPPGMVIISQAYNLQLYTKGGPQEATLSQPARLVLNYNPSELPPDVSALFIGYYEPELGWVLLQPTNDYIAGDGSVAALISRFAKFSILASVKASEQVMKPVIPARFEVSNLTLSAGWVNSGSHITVRVNVANIGGISGEHVLTLKVNGLFVDSELVRLAPGQNRNVGFNISPYSPGIYEVEIDGLRETFSVGGSEPVLVPVPSINWLMAGIILAVIALLLPFFLVIGRRRRLLGFSTVAQTITTDTPSAAITIRLRNAAGKLCKVKKNTVILLSSSSPGGRFDIIPGGTFNGRVSSLIIPEGSTEATFYYRDSSTGTATISVEESPGLGWKKESQQIIVKPPG